jgi:dienelactone hydrolase
MSKLQLLPACLVVLLGSLMSAELPAQEEAPVRYEQRQMSFTLENGREIEVDLRMPVDVEGPHPAVMVFAGFEAAGYVLDLLPPTLPVVKVSFDYPYDPPRRAGGVIEAMGYLPQARDAIHMTLEAIGILHHRLAAMPEIDAERITIAGVSLGAPFATIAAQRYDIPGVAIIHGFGEVPVVIRNIMHRRLERNMGRWAMPVSRLLTRIAVWYGRVPTPEDYARRYSVNHRVLVIDASEDHLVPDSARQALHDALGASQARISTSVTPGGHVDEGQDELIADILQRMADWLREEGMFITAMQTNARD